MSLEEAPTIRPMLIDQQGDRNGGGGFEPPGHLIRLTNTFDKRRSHQDQTHHHSPMCQFLTHNKHLSFKAWVAFRIREGPARTGAPTRKDKTVGPIFKAVMFCAVKTLLIGNRLRREDYPSQRGFLIGRAGSQEPTLTTETLGECHVRRA